MSHTLKKIFKKSWKNITTYLISHKIVPKANSCMYVYASNNLLSTKVRSLPLRLNFLPNWLSFRDSKQEFTFLVMVKKPLSTKIKTCTKKI